jgi:hypothetical protein
MNESHIKEIHQNRQIYLDVLKKRQESETRENEEIAKRSLTFPLLNKLFF